MCTITFLTTAGQFRQAKVGDPLCAVLRAEGAEVIRIDNGHTPTPWGPRPSDNDLTHVNGWTFDPVAGEWLAKVAINTWRVVKGDLDNPPQFTPAHIDELEVETS